MLKEMTDMICLDKDYSTTRLLTKEQPKIINNTEDKFESVLFLQESENRQGEGGLRTQGYFKRSYEGNPLISIITVVYNGEEFLEETILSVINQSYDNVEYIIIDGGSTDGAIDILKRYEDRIDYWVSEKDEGIYDAMNKGVRKSTGEWLFFLGADDCLSNHEVFRKVSKHFDNDIGIIYGNILYEGVGIFKSSYNWRLLLKNTLHHQASFYRNSLLSKINFNPAYKISSDYEVNLFAYLKGVKAKKIDVMVSRCSPEGCSGEGQLVGYLEEVEIRCKYTNFPTSIVLAFFTIMRFFLKKAIQYVRRYFR